MTPVVAIVGRPNVGKSTLMNRILGRREAIVEERPGVTRDRKEVEASWQGRDFTLVDTGGWIAGGDTLDDKVSRQSEKAIREADAVLFVVDATVGVTEDDARVAGLLRLTDGPVIVVANKVDDRVAWWTPSRRRSSKPSSRRLRRVTGWLAWRLLGDPTSANRPCSTG